MWHALRGNLAFFLVGAILGACIVSVATENHANSNFDIQNLQIDVARNAERIAELNKDMQTVMDWIAATDRQKVKDAEILGEIHVTVANHDKLVWMAFANLVAITILLGRHVLVHSKKENK